MSTIQRNVTAGCWDLDLATGALRLCPTSKKMFGFDPASKGIITEKQWLEHLHPDDWSAVQQAMSACMLNGRPYAERFRTIHPDGSMHLVLGIGRPMGKLEDRARFGGWNFDLETIGAFAATWLSENPHALDTEHIVAIRTPSEIRPIECDGPKAFNLLELRAKAVLRARALCDDLLGVGIAQSHAFDLLLYLYAQASAPVTTAELVASLPRAPTTVAARWISSLEQQGLIDVSDQGEGSASVELSTVGRARLEAFLSRR